MSDIFDAKEHLLFQVRKDITYLYKRLLTELEDVKNRHWQMIGKLRDSLSPESQKLVDAANFLDNTEYAYLRKKVLDAGNDAIRGIVQEIEQFNVTIK